MKDYKNNSCVSVVGGSGSDAALESAFSILTGREDGNDLSAVVQRGRDGLLYFLNDNCWWRYVDFQCTFHATYGWRPFFDSDYRLIDYNTWSLCFKHQADQEMIDEWRKVFPCVPPVGFLPQNAYPLDRVVVSVENFFNNFRVFQPEWSADSPDPYADKYDLFDREGRHDTNHDYPLLNTITAADWLLWERDIDRAPMFCRQIEMFLDVVFDKMSGGLILIGPQGSQIEFGHGGFRYPSSTNIYLLKSLRSLREVYLMLGETEKAESAEEKAYYLESKIGMLKHESGWWLSGLSSDFKERLGTGEIEGESGYFEVWPNVNSVVLDISSSVEAEAIVNRIASVPALVDNHLTLSNYPARPLSELDDDHDGFPPPGTHLNGGWFWMHGGSALASFARVRHEDTIMRLSELLEDHANHFSVDCYNDWGRNKESQWKHLHVDGPTYSVTCAGSFGMIFRAILGVSAFADGLRFAPAVPLDVDSISFIRPINYGGRPVYVSVKGSGGNISEAYIDGQPYFGHDAASLIVNPKDLENGSKLEIIMGE